MPHSRDLPAVEDATVAIFSDDAAPLAVDQDQSRPTWRLKTAGNAVVDSSYSAGLSYKFKSVQIYFACKRQTEALLHLGTNGTIVPNSNNVSYLGMTLQI